jgi:hypothetical protein
VHTLIGILIILLFQMSAQALELTPESKLRKLSFQMRGMPPAMKDFEELAKAKGNEAQLSTFFKSKVDEYFKSPWAAVRFTERIFDDWRIDRATDYLSPDVYNNQTAKVDSSKNELELTYPTISATEKSLHKLIQMSLSQGKSIDEILISQSFRKSLKIASAIEVLTNYYSTYFKQKIALFKADAAAKGFKTETADEIKIALAEFDKVNPNPNQQPQDPAANPYFFNSKKDVTLTTLVIQGALENNNPTKKQELLNYLGSIKDFDTYQSNTLGVIPTNGNNGSLPHMVFALNEMTTRYQKTIYSKAAAFFRIYLCDDMQQVSLPGKNSKSQEAFNAIHKAVQNEIKAEEMAAQPAGAASAAAPAAPPPPAPVAPALMAMIAAKHVKPECAGCHNKLDPMESIYNNKFKRTLSQGNEAPKPNPFEFFYEDYSGKDIKISVENVDNLPEVVSKQPQYIRCQSEKMWNWFMGTDVPLSPKQRVELEKVYVAAESKPLEIIKYIVSLKSYESDSFLSEPKQFNNVRPIFQKCHGCHKTDPAIPSLMNIPFNMDKQTLEEKMADHLEILTSVVKQTNILGDQPKIKMPTKDAGWKLSDLERATLIKWIADGAKDEEGKDTLTDEQRKKILSKAKEGVMEMANRAATVAPTLRPTWQRFMDYSDIGRTLPVKLGSTACSGEIVVKKASLGSNNKLTGAPVVDRPENAYREAYKDCIVKLLMASKGMISQMSYSAAAPVPAARFQLYALGLMSWAVEKGQAMPAANVFELAKQQKWTDLTEPQKMRIVQEQIQYLVGPNMNHIAKEAQLGKIIFQSVDKKMSTAQENSLIDATYFSLYYVLNSDSFSIY